MEESSIPPTFNPPTPPPPAGGFPPSPPPPYSYAPPQPAARTPFSWGAFLGGTLFGCGCLPLLGFVLFSAALGGIVSSMAGGSGKSGATTDSVALINVSGVITSGEPGGGIIGGASGADAQDLIEELEKARKDEHVKSIVIWINSPGGSAAGSDDVYQEVERVRSGGKKVVVSMGDVAASGGYYIASAADRIFAGPSTITGSIGVISEFPNFSDPNGWIKKSGYDEIVVKSGKFKDMGNPLRPMTADERALFQQMVNDIYEQFLTAVSKARNIPVATLRPLADGRVYTGRRALALHLVDQIGNLRDAIAYAGEQGGLGSDPKIYKMGGTPLGKLFGGNDSMYQGIGPRQLLGLLLLDPHAAELSRGVLGTPRESSQ